MAGYWDVSADEIAQWASTTSAAATLPKLIRRLLHATVPVRSLTMRADAGIGLPGWDGIVEASTTSPFCPDGVSYWELSIEADVRRKVERDFAKRAASAREERRGTFVFVTARRFPRKEQWAREKEKLDAFSAIWVLDADDLATWLEQAPSVSRWFHNALGRPASGAIDVETFVASWEKRTMPPLSATLAIAGNAREAAAASLRTWLNTDAAASISIRGDTREEVVLFVAAAMSRGAAFESEQWMSRTLIVETEEAWRWLSESARAFRPILVPIFPELDVGRAEHVARSGRAQVIVPLDNAASDNSDAIQLEPIPHPRLAEQLKRIGVGENDAQRLARESGGKLTALQRLFRYVAIPEWIRADDQSALIAMLLVGAWDPSNDADASAIQRLGAEPAAVDALCARLAAGPDAPIGREATRGGRGVWRWTAPLDAWRALARRIGQSQLLAFRDLAIEVLTELDPKYEMPISERFYAGARGQVIAHSSSLRQGIAESLVRLALTDEELRSTFHTSLGTRTSELVVLKVLEGTWKTWASVSGLLPVLAEAAPARFLECVERSLTTRGEVGITQLLRQEDSFGGSPHTGLLWALEGLGWHPDFFSRVALTLAQLAVHDPPGSKLANRPFRSLGGLLHPVLPQSKSSAIERVEVIRSLLERTDLDEIPWRLAVVLSAGISAGGVLFNSHRPRYLAWELPPEHPEHGARDAAEQVERTFELLLLHVGADPRRWESLLEPVWRIGRERAREILAALESTRTRVVDDQQLVWSALRQLLARGRKFGDAWHIDRSLLDVVEALYAAFTPLDPVARVVWLFANRSEIPDSSDDWSESQRKKARYQRDAITELWGSDSRWRLISELVSRAEQPAAIAIALAEVAPQEADLKLLGEGMDERLASLLPAYVWTRSTNEGLEWAIDVLKSMLSGGRHEDALSIAFASGPNPRLWAEIDELGEPFRSSYWSRVQHLYGEFAPEDVELAIRRLIDHHNAVVAIDLASRMAEVVAPATALDVLLSLRNVGDNAMSSFVRSGGADYHVERVFEIVDRDESLDGDVIASLEINLFPLLEHSARGARQLWQRLRASPQLFASLVAALYRARDDEREAGGEPSASAADDHERSRQRAETAYHLLNGWRDFPGSDLPASEREAALFDWSREVLRATAEQRRRAVGEIEVARVLARAPAAEDGMWPCRAARILLEEARFPDLRDGLITGQLNLRGVTTRAVGEGGDQERVIASSLRAAARKLRAHWTRSSGLLDDLADEYERRADDEDAIARADRDRYGIERDVAPEQQPETQTRAAFRHLVSLSLQSVGPAPTLDVPLAERLTLLTGQNSVGKTFILDVLWWALTGTWSDAPAWPRQQQSDGTPSEISVVVDGGQRLVSRYGSREEVWTRPSNFGRSETIVLYCRVDGTFAVWDGLRCAQTPARADFSDAFVFSGRSVWEGLPQEEDGTVASNGAIRDIVSWETRRPDLIKVLDEVLKTLSPSDEPMRLGNPVRLSVRDAREFPTLAMAYGDVPIIHASAAVKRIFGLAYLLVWAWNEHLEAASTANVPPYDDIVVLVDEPEAHLHPLWQRQVLPALFRAVSAVNGAFAVQLVACTHSPLVAASLESIFDDATDRLLHVEVESNGASVHEIPWAKQGDASQWLMSPAFGLTEPRSAEAEAAIKTALDFAKGVAVGVTRRQVTDMLRHALPGDDPFLVRWVTVLEPS